MTMLPHFVRIPRNRVRVPVWDLTPAVDRKRLSGNPTGMLARKEQNAVGNILR